MSIPKEYKSRFVYHFTHIDNLKSILKYGLLSTNLKEKKGLGHTIIAYEEIQGRRAAMPVTCGPGGVVHDYVPLYFCIRSPMLLAVITNKMADEQFIIYLEFPISIIEDYPSVFTDASANTDIPPNFYDDPKDLDKVGWDIVDTWKWGRQHDEPGKISRKQAKMAEVLIRKRLDASEIKRIIVWNEGVADEVKQIYKEKGLSPPPIAYGDKEFYFINGLRPPVTGPYFIKDTYEKTVDGLLKHFEQFEATSPRYNSMREMRDALTKDFDCLPETAELVGLESDNPMHTEDVATHSLSVLRQLSVLPEYKELRNGDKVIVDLAAFLHDIGKGPKSRWADKGGKQKVDPDHPQKALPMLKRILTEEVRRVRTDAVRLLCKLVCYHDIIGDIAGKGRRIEELEDIVEDERELDMLIAIGKADVLTIDFSWWNEEKVFEIRKRVLKTLENRANTKE